MILEGNLLKMRVILENPVRYFLKLGEEEICVNDLIDKQVELEYLNKIHCIKCGRLTSRSFAQGYCFPCFRSAPETEDCVLRPEMCLAHEGVARDIKYAELHCLIDHYAYLSYTSGIKVGVTRHTQIPARWIDQGAVAAIKIAQTPNRYTSGLIEVALKSHFNDKTNWRNMLKSNELTTDLLLEKKKAINKLPDNLKSFVSSDNEISYIDYPNTNPPENVSSINLDKNNYFSDILSGIKGQYLIFNDGYVINIRKYGGYLIRLKY